MANEPRSQASHRITYPRFLLDALDAAHPGFAGRLHDDDGNLRRFVNVYVNEEDIRFLQNKATALKDGDEISIIPAIAGG